MILIQRSPCFICNLPTKIQYALDTLIQPHSANRAPFWEAVARMWLCLQKWASSFSNLQMILTLVVSHHESRPTHMGAFERSAHPIFYCAPCQIFLCPKNPPKVYCTCAKCMIMFSWLKKICDDINSGIYKSSVCNSLDKSYKMTLDWKTDDEQKWGFSHSNLNES